MTDSVLAFSRSLYVEHFEELSFLYENRKANLCSDELRWEELQDEENRIEAHLDALVIGGQMALHAMLDVCNEGDPHGAYVVTCLFCRHQDLRGLFKFFAILDPENAEVLACVRDGLIQDWPDEWFPALANYPFHEFPFLLAIFLPLHAHRCQPLDQKLFQVAVSSALCSPDLYLASARRLSATRLLPPSHWQLSDQEAAHTLREKALSLLQLADSTRVLDYFQKRLPESLLPLDALMAGADEATARVLCQPVATPSAARIVAMGLSGLRDVIVPLLGYLEDEKLAPVAAVALHTITGADLTCVQFVEEEWNEDELFPDELQAFREGKPPQHPDGGPYGVGIEVLSTDADVWRQWLREHARQFQPGVRYRLGYPVSPAVLVYALSHPLSTRLIRTLTYEELILRYGATIAFNPGDWVGRQKQVIAELNRWAQAASQQCQPGSWSQVDHGNCTGVFRVAPQGVN